jgi:hypothetical protein
MYALFYSLFHPVLLHDSEIFPHCTLITKKRDLMWRDKTTIHWTWWGATEIWYAFITTCTIIWNGRVIDQNRYKSEYDANLLVTRHES